MPLKERIESLKHKHHQLDQAIDTENARPMPDATVLHDLKRQKLRVKEEIETLAHTSH